jgi:hypothetical protein
VSAKQARGNREGDSATEGARVSQTRLIHISASGVYIARVSRDIIREKYRAMLFPSGALKCRADLSLIYKHQ